MSRDQDAHSRLVPMWPQASTPTGISTVKLQAAMMTDSHNSEILWRVETNPREARSKLEVCCDHIGITRTAEETRRITGTNHKDAQAVAESVRHDLSKRYSPRSD